MRALAELMCESCSTFSPQLSRLVTCSLLEDAMGLECEMVHAKSLSFANQRKVVILRDVKKLSWDKIALKVKNRQGNTPSAWLCRNVYNEFDRTKARRKYKYHMCGRKAWKVTREVELFVVGKLKALRNSTHCTSTVLQKILASEKGIALEGSTIRKILKKHGYKWMPRSRKPKYSKERRQERLRFARKVEEMDLEEEVDLCMDGVLFSVPPTEAAARENYCLADENFMYRKPSENAAPETSGASKYSHQTPKYRCVPMWAGIGPAGVGFCFWHENKKVDQTEWAEAVDAGEVTSACKEASGRFRPRRPWLVLCDNESFLQAPASRAAHRRRNIELLQIPARSPDLNPVEKFWSWVRRQVRDQNLADLREGRPPVTKQALKRRIRALLRSNAAREVAKKTFKGLRNVCRQVIAKKGAATRG